MTTSFNPDAPDFTPSFTSGLSAFAMEFSPTAAEFVFQPIVPVDEPAVPEGGSVVPETEVVPPPSVPPAPGAEVSPVQIPAPAVEKPQEIPEEVPAQPAEPEKPTEVEKPIEAEKPTEPVVQKQEKPETERPYIYAKDFVMSLREACRVLPPEALIPENYSLYGLRKGKKAPKPQHADKWTTLPKYTLAKSENSFANYVKTLTSEQEKEVQQVRLLINKITEKNYAKMLQSLYESYDYSGYLLEKLSWFIYERATMHHSFSEMYAKLCVDLKGRFMESEKKEIAKNFRVLILEKCEKAFYKQEVVEGNELIDAETKRRVRLSGNVKFIGHLFQLKFISPRVIHECFQVQLNEQSLSDESIETFCMLFHSVAPLLRTRTKDPAAEVEELREVYERVASLRNDERFSIRIRFLIQTLIDKRNELLTGERDPKPVPSPLPSPSKEIVAPAGSKYRRVEYDAASETRRIKIPTEIVRDLKDVLLQNEQLPAKVLGAKVNSIVSKQSLYRPEVIYQICKFALCDSVEEKLEYFANLIVKSFPKKKCNPMLVQEGLLVAAANLKDLQLDCPKADAWLKTIVSVVRNKEGLTEEQRMTLETKIGEQMTAEVVKPVQGVEEPDEILSKEVKLKAEAVIREYLLSGNLEAGVEGLTELKNKKSQVLAHMLRYVLVSRPVGEAGLFFAFLKQVAARGNIAASDISSMLEEVAKGLEDISEDCPKAREVLTTHTADLISCNVVPEKHYF